MTDRKVVVIGAGVGGIAAAIALKQQLKFENFTVYEKAWDVGGTWRENSYPGCGCDVPSHWYSLSTDWNPAWSAEYASQPEILAYLQNVTKRRDILRHIEFGAKLVNGFWDASRSLYVIEVERFDKAGNSIKTEIIEAHALISAIGGLHLPEFPNIKGLDSFKGQMWHAAQWRHDVTLAGKRVGIIGNGCSGAQIVPSISKDPSVKVINFCRTPSWFAPRRQFIIPPLLKWIFAHVPFIAALYRFFIYAMSDSRYVLWKKNSTWIRGIVEWSFARQMRQKTPPHLHDKLIPKYNMGCKRIICDPGYLESLWRPNVNLEWDAIAEIIPDGILLKNGRKHELDIIVACTGFAVSSMVTPVSGLDGTLSEYFKSHDGPTAYKGTSVPGFPNLFIILGPNVASGHGSAIFVEECQVNYAIKMIKPLLEGKYNSAVVKHTVTDEYNANLQEKIKGTVWDTCFSYYNQQGKKNIAMFPATLTTFWRMLSRPAWKDYEISPPSAAVNLK